MNGASGAPGRLRRQGAPRPWSWLAVYFDLRDELQRVLGRSVEMIPRGSPQARSRAQRDSDFRIAAMFDPHDEIAAGQGLHRVSLRL